jgi:UDP-N-acetyl-D-glucosamine dehydrogenase
MPFYPGPGLGGHCIPIDPHYLAWKLKALNYNARFIELASEINSHMPEFVVDKVMRGLNEMEKSVKGSRILLVGVAYKADVNDVRESPALDIITLLEKMGAKVDYHDPHVPVLSEHGLTMESVALDDARLVAADCVVITTNHSGVDHASVAQKAKLIVDTRNALKNVAVSGQLIRL